LKTSEFQPEGHISDEQKVYYRALKTRALQAIRLHHGEEATYRALMDALAELETWMRNTFGDETMKRLSDDDERGIALITESQSGTITDLLSRTSQRLTNLSKGELTPAQIASAHRILHVHEDAVLVPPDELEIKRGNGNGEWKEREYSPRLQELIALLAEHEIYTDDIVCVTGTNAKNMIRRESYVLVEIPRLKKQILICNEVGEATFISHAILSRRTFFQSTKDDLLGMGLERIVYGPTWGEQLTASLFREGEEPQKKVNVRDREEMRKLITASITSQKWLGLNSNERVALCFSGKRLSAIGNLFGINGRPGNHFLAYIRLGAAIFGADDPFIAPVLKKTEEKWKVVEEQRKQVETLGNDLEKWRIYITKKISAEQWINTSVVKRNTFTFVGRSLTALATLFNVTGRVPGNNLLQLRLGAAIYGADDPFIAPALKKAEEEKIQAETLGEDAVKWKEYISTHVTSEDWINLKDRKMFSLAGKKLIALARLFGIEGDPLSNTLVRLRLGAAIFGAEDPFIAPALKKAEEENTLVTYLGDDLARWRTYITERITAETWVNMTYAQREDIVFSGKGLKALSNLFGVEGDARYSTLIYLRLGAAIFGAEDPFIAPALKKAEEENTLVTYLGDDLARWRTYITERITAETWVNMTHEQRKVVSFGDRGYKSIAALFGMEHGNHLSHLRFGASIFGINDPCVAPALKKEEKEWKVEEECKRQAEPLGKDPEKWRTYITERITAEAWVNLTQKRRLQLSFAGKRLNAIATLFDIDGKPTGYSSVHLRLGAAIYGADDPYIKSAIAACEAKKKEKGES
jgi:hypothetical protein